MKKRQKNRFVTLWNEVSNTFTQIRKSELAPGMVQCKIQGRPGLVWREAASVDLKEIPTSHQPVGKMAHLTMNSGSLTTFDPAACQSGLVRAIRQLYPKGGLLPAPWADLHIDFGASPGSASFTIWRADVPMLFNAVCWSASVSDETFAAIERQYLSHSEKFPDIMSLFGTACHVAPPQTPWLATLLMPTLLYALPTKTLQDLIFTIAKLEQAAAAALVPTTA